MPSGVMHKILSQATALSRRQMRIFRSLRAYPPGGKIHTFSLAPYLHFLTKS